MNADLNILLQKTNKQTKNKKRKKKKKKTELIYALQTR